jgi:hypothetical protein
MCLHELDTIVSSIEAQASGGRDYIPIDDLLPHRHSKRPAA